MDVNQFGCFAEYMFAVEAMKHDLFVSFPILHTSVYDCIVESNKGLYKIQIKAINENNRTRERVILKKRNGDCYNTNEIDYFAVYSKNKNGFFILKNNGDVKNFELSSIKNSIYFNNFALL
tara:strand:+ start:2955 stop:3317 length:363 start_codon:yes stop_codon:yes gene_type:complete